MDKEESELLPEILTTDEAAAALRRKVQTLRKWHCFGTGPIQPVKVGRRLGWKRDDVEKLIGGPAFRRRSIEREHQAAPTRSSAKEAAPSMSSSDHQGDGMDAIFGDLDLEQLRAQMPYCKVKPDAELPAWYLESIKEGTSPYKRGELLVDKQLRGMPYRVERVLVDQDTGVRFYILKRIDINRELLRSQEVVENPTCFGRWKDM